MFIVHRISEIPPYTRLSPNLFAISHGCITYQRLTICQHKLAQYPATPIDSPFNRSYDFSPYLTTVLLGVFQCTVIKTFFKSDTQNRFFYFFQVLLFVFLYSLYTHIIPYTNKKSNKYIFVLLGY